MLNEPFKNHNLDEATQESDWVSAPNILRTDKTLSIKDFFVADDTEVKMLKGQRINRTGISTLVTGAHYTLAANDYLVAITSLSYAPQIGLPRPSAVGAGKTFIVKDEVGGAASTTITVQSDGEKTVDGATSATITTNYGSKRFYSDGANWFVY